MHENLCSASQIHDTIHMACCELQLRRIQKSCIGVGADLASLCLCYLPRLMSPILVQVEVNKVTHTDRGGIKYIFNLVIWSVNHVL